MTQEERQKKRIGILKARMKNCISALENPREELDEKQREKITAAANRMKERCNLINNKLRQTKRAARKK